VIITTEESVITTHNKNQVMGYIIVVIGIVLQFLAFYLALTVYFNPSIVEGFLTLIESDDGLLGRMINSSLLFSSLVILFAMGVIGGLIGKYGLELSRHRSPDGRGDE